MYVYVYDGQSEIERLAGSLNAGLSLGMIGSRYYATGRSLVVSQRAVTLVSVSGIVR